MNDMLTTVSSYCALPRTLQPSWTISSPWSSTGLRSCWRHNMTKKYWVTTATLSPEPSRRSFLTILPKSKEYVAPMTTNTYSSWSSRSWLIVRGAQPLIQQRVGLQELKRIYEAKGFDPTHLRHVRKRGTTQCACVFIVFGCALMLHAHFRAQASV